MPYEVHDDKIVMRAGKYNLPRCCCGEPWQLNTVHREKTPCFSYIERKWVGLTDQEVDALYTEHRDYVDFYEAIEASLKEKNQ